jgi:hypothetical protein
MGWYFLHGLRDGEDGMAAPVAAARRPLGANWRRREARLLADCSRVVRKGEKVGKWERGRVRKRESAKVRKRKREKARKRWGRDRELRLVYTRGSRLVDTRFALIMPPVDCSGSVSAFSSTWVPRGAYGRRPAQRPAGTGAPLRERRGLQQEAVIVQLEMALVQLEMALGPREVRHGGTGSIEC